MTSPSFTPERSNLLWGGLALIVIGGIFLARNFELIYFGRHWWAFFMLIPLFYMFSAYQRHRRASGGTFTPEVRNSFLGMFAIAFVMCVFLFELRWHAVWPVFIILAGVSLLLGPRK